MRTDLPTGAKATAALSFGVVGWLVANTYVANMPIVTAVGSLREFVAVLGMVVGWMVMGRSVGKPYLDAVSAGWKTMAILLFSALVLGSIIQMLRQSVRLVYDGPLDAIVDVFNIMIARSGPIFTPGVMTVAALGGAVAAVLSENAHRRWR